MVKHVSNTKDQPFLFIIHPNVLENAINSKQVLSPLPTTVHWSLQPRESPQTKTFTTPGLPKGPSFKPNHKPDFDFLSTDMRIICDT